MKAKKKTWTLFKGWSNEIQKNAVDWLPVLQAIMAGKRIKVELKVVEQ